MSQPASTANLTDKNNFRQFVSLRHFFFYIWHTSITSQRKSDIISIVLRKNHNVTLLAQQLGLIRCLDTESYDQGFELYHGTSLLDWLVQNNNSGQVFIKSQVLMALGTVNALDDQKSLDLLNQLLREKIFSEQKWKGTTSFFLSVESMY